VVDLLSADAVQVRPGQRVIIDSWGGTPPLNGRVNRVEPIGKTKVSALGIEEQRVDVVIDFTDPPARWQKLGHGFRVETRIVLWEADDVLKVPMSALYRVGERSHVLEAVFGSRSCDGDAVTCQVHLNAGGWGTAVTGGAEVAPIPNRHVYFVANVVDNPSPYQSQWQQLEVQGPQTPPAASNVPDPAHADDDLRFLGNVIWNGLPDHPLGLGDGTGCDDGNPTCNAAQILADNSINSLAPSFANAAANDFHLVLGSALAAATSPAIPAFPGGDLPGPPAPPAAIVDFAVACDRDGSMRPAGGPPGAYGTPALIFADGFESGDTSRW